jgi:hypothetical protein
MKFKLILILALLSEFINAQDIINPYNNNLTRDDLLYDNSTSLYSRDFLFNGLRFNNGAYYNGEYEISIEKLPWYYLFIDPAFSVNPHLPLIYAISYSYEVVSLPFMMDCVYSSGNCTEQVNPCSTHVRNLSLPMEDAQHFTFLQNNNYFQYVTAPPFPNTSDKLYLKTPLREFITYQSSGNMGGGNFANTLVSGGFKNSGGIGDNRFVLPHGIIKTTINIHCGPDIFSDPIVKTLSYYYDNTRGRMRYYPFLPCNLNMGGQGDWDVIFVPEILYAPGNYDIDPNNNAQYPEYLLPDGSLSYFPPDENTVPASGCSSVVNVPTTNTIYDPELLLQQNQNTYQNIIPNSTNIFPSPYALLSSPLRNSQGHCFAGYDRTGLAGAYQTTDKPGIRHSYFIDQNTDLNIINPSDKIIYNPSEATITASDFIFPQGYTFKTIRGVYPSPVDAANANILLNGCNPCDLRDAPAKSDLTSENPDDAVNFPLSAQPATQHLYASRYYLENNSRLTIENCVRLFDCTFDVKQGATTVFNDYPALFGKEDHSFDRADARFKIQTLGGAVLRNYADVQYLQNGNITQATPLHYKAINEIYAGNNVEPDADVPQQDYVVQNGADVTLEAGDVIYLKDGFHAMAGSTFSAIASSPGSSSGPCTPVSISLRRAGEAGNNAKTNENSIQAYPNPSARVFKLHQDFMPFAAHKITLLDTFGRTIFSKSNVNSFTDKIDLSDQPNGIYVALVNSDSKIQSIKLVVNH